MTSSHRLTRLRAILLAAAPALALTLAACAQTPPAPQPASARVSADEAAIRQLIDTWYAEHRAGPDGRTDTLRAPYSIDASPGYFHPHTESAAAPPPVYNSLAHTALVFSHEISDMQIDPRFAKVRAWERGYFYAWAAQRTFERLGSALFVLEKDDRIGWRVLAHNTNTVGIPPGMHTDPMPDLRELFYSTVGKDRDPDADARAAAGG